MCMSPAVPSLSLPRPRWFLTISLIHANRTRNDSDWGTRHGGGDRQEESKATKAQLLSESVIEVCIAVLTPYGFYFLRTSTGACNGRLQYFPPVVFLYSHLK